MSVSRMQSQIKIYVSQANCKFDLGVRWLSVYKERGQLLNQVQASLMMPPQEIDPDTYRKGSLV